MFDSVLRSFAPSTSAQPSRPVLGPMLSFAYISQSDHLCLCATPYVLPFSDPTFHSKDLRIDRGAIHISLPGIYQANLMINVPTGLVLHTRISMQLDGQDLLGTLHHIDQPLTSSPGTYLAIQCLFEVPDSGILQVTSSDPMQFVAPSPEATIASLVLLKIR